MINFNLHPKQIKHAFRACSNFLFQALSLSRFVVSIRIISLVRLSPKMDEPFLRILNRFRLFSFKNDLQDQYHFEVEDHVVGALRHPVK